VHWPGLHEGSSPVLHHGGVDDYADFGRLCGAVYVAARAGAVDCTAAFDLAASWLEDDPQDPDATELAMLSLDCARAGQPRLAEVALRLLAAHGFRPGFAEEPALLARLEEAMDLVNRDLAATGIHRRCLLRVYDDDGLNWPVNAYVQAWDGRRGTAQGVHPGSGANPVWALVDVAEDAQDAIMHSLWAAWPLCPVHGLGAHAQEHEGAAVWWCAGGGGHAVTPIGEWRGR